MKGELERLKEHLTFVGLLKDEALSWFYHLIDFIVIPSRSECLSLVQIEGCLSGKPSICSNVPGARDVVKSTGFGLIFESENTVDLADKLVQAVEQRDELLSRFPALQKKFDIDAIREAAYHFLVP
jgi:glycosyltransferase involved in cell wall biosynthesis